MSTAIQRLIARPSSLAFLRRLVRAEALEYALQRASKEPYICARCIRCQTYLSGVAATPSKEISTCEAVVDNAIRAEPNTHESTKNHPEPEPIPSYELPNEQSLPPILDASGFAAPWGAYLRTYEDVEFHSDLGRESDDSRKLVDDPSFSNDFTLWAYLLEFRKRQHGNAGVAVFWAAIRKRGLLLPTEGPVAHILWPKFLQAGFEDKELLSDICQYADEMYDSSGKHWSKLYAYILQHMILKEERDSMLQWHERLIERHHPGPAAFSRLVRNIIVMGGDLEALKLLYRTSFYKTHHIYKTYGKVIPSLIGRKDFHKAMNWHFFLVRRGDSPLNQKVVRPLIRHFEIYNPGKARILKESLVSADTSLADNMSADTKRPEMISREMMNIVHGKAFGIEPKKYNDRLGARWFATKWISLDLAINTIHAFGINEIGPLSLQAIALREADASGVVRRIDQLQQLGISIGNFVFSRAIESFARNGEIEHLEGLLGSDQHPDSYEDKQLQDRLMDGYARTEDWSQYRLTAAIQAVEFHGPPIKRYNKMQQANIFRGDRTAFFKMLEEMRVQRIPFTRTTVLCVIQHFLPPRNKGRGPAPGRENLDDLQTTISVLTTIMKFGSYIPPTAWREVIRRLGMLGQLDDLEKLCLWLAAWYNPKSAFHSRYAKVLSPILTSRDRYLAPSQIPTSHEFHPLRILFSNSLQRAIVEWAFKHEPLRQPVQSLLVLEGATAVNKLAEESACHYTRGVQLLRQLQDEGVYVDVSQIRRALRNRFAILFNPGHSRVARNNLLRQQNVSSRMNMVEYLNKVWGADIWLDANSE